ncbi:MAG: hypothetical protein CL553_01360 [Alcanivorax sp.]|nr:hypothetical protein [Alcanivorax sp.]|tara:strand:- start:266 stop:859 length:594 start_codon:yes stop_codon:yes gene_type:complete
MDADFSTAELHYQTAVVRNARLRQDALFEPWTDRFDVFRGTAVVQLHRVAGFSPDGGLSHAEGWEYVFLYNTLYVLETPYGDSTDLYQLLLTYDATVAVRYLATGEQSLETLRAEAYDAGLRAMRPRWRAALAAQLEQAGYGTAFRERYAQVDGPVMQPSNKGPWYQEDEPLKPGANADQDRAGSTSPEHAPGGRPH